jgi:hypothetical protein
MHSRNRQSNEKDSTGEFIKATLVQPLLHSIDGVLAGTRRAAFVYVPSMAITLSSSVAYHCVEKLGQIWSLKSIAFSKHEQCIVLRQLDCGIPHENRVGVMIGVNFPRLPNHSVFH